MKFTKGPWRAKCGSVERLDGAPIAHMDRTDEASKAGIYPVERDYNAKLIATAPELLKVCKMLLGYKDDKIFSGTLLELAAFTKSAHIMAHEVVKKAEGR